MEETTEQLEQTANVKPDAETAFILVKEWDGGWRVLTYMANTFTIEREALRHDVKTGCREMYDFLTQDDIATLVSSKLSAPTPTDSQRTSESIRHALTERDML